MANDNGLVDKYEKLNKIIELAKQKKTNIRFGVYKKCSITEY